MSDLSALAALVRLPAALTVPGDIVAGAAASSWRLGARRTAGLAAASTCLYWAGMALNDWADRDLDARERPQRPIPSGRVSPATALGVAGGLTAAGLAVGTAAGGRRAAALLFPLAGSVWAYDLALKSTPLGPAAMAATRGLDVLLGAGGARSALPVAATVAAHTAAVTGLSRSETTAAGPAPARAALAGTAAVTALAAVTARLGRRTRLRNRVVGVGLLANYATALGRAQWAAARDPRPATVQRAVGAGILGLVPLEAALSSTRAPLPVVGALASLWPLARRLSRRVSPT